MIRNVVRLLVYCGLTFLTLVVLDPALLTCLSGGTRGKHTREQRHFAAVYKAGDTNVPLLAMDWFSENGVYFCRVTQEGKVFSARDVGHAIQGGTGISSRFSLGNQERKGLLSAIDNLPAPSKSWVPTERKILVSGIRSNQWFTFVYDRANVPPAVETLYGLTAAYLEWFVPKVGWQPYGVEHSMSQRPPELVCHRRGSTYCGL
jgi:hypothetical protein